MGENTAATQRNERAARRLCALLYRNRKTSGRFQLTLDQLVEQTRATPKELERILHLAEDQDWIRRRHGLVALKATGIFVAKQVLGIPDA